MGARPVDVVVIAHGLRVLLVEDSKVLTERLIEAIRQIPEVELIGTADTEAGALAAVKREAGTRRSPWARRISSIRRGTTDGSPKSYTRSAKHISPKTDAAVLRRRASAGAARNVYRPHRQFLHRRPAGAASTPHSVINLTPFAAR
jgi:hypothetical protein